MPLPPSIAVLMPAYDAEAFVEEALRSALAQDYPADRLRVIVVDDGSTDATAEVVARVAAQQPGRVTLIRQENRGLVGAVNRAAEAAGDVDLIALLDADDVWPAGKIARQVELLQQRPDVGLVYTDMRVIDEAGTVLEPSWLEGVEPPQGSSLATFLEQNHVTASSIVVRGALREHLFPIPAEMPWADWWLAVRCAQVSAVAYLDEPKTLYRFHGANMSLGSHGERRLRELRKSLRLQRWFLRRLEAPVASVGELEHAWESFERLARHALEAAGTPFARLLEVTAADAEQADAGATRAEELLEAGDVHGALAAAVRAAAADPGSEAARRALVAARVRVPGGRGPQPLRGAHPFVVGVHADEVSRDPSLLRACAEALHGVPGVTIAVDAGTADPHEAVERIGGLVGDLRSAEGGALDVDIALVTGPLDELGRARLAHGLCAVAGTRGGDGSTPAFTPDELGALRVLALEHAGALVA